MHMLQLNVPLILASQSPRRRRLLEQLGFDFEVRAPSDDEEIDPTVSPEDMVLQLALEKGKPVADERPDALTLAADTIVVLDGAVLGKPADAAEAKSMLRALSGKTHTVYTGIAVLHSGTDRCVTGAVATDVTFGVLSDEEIERYVQTGSPLDKAGAYGIQDDAGSYFISRIDGDYYNVVGLPLHRFYRILRTAYVDLIAA